MIKIEVDDAYSLDMLSILEVKKEFLPSDRSFKEYDKFRKNMIKQLGENKFYDLLKSVEYGNLKKTNSDIFNLVNLLKTGLVRATYIDYLNWVRFFWKTEINKKFDKEQLEVKVGYNWDALKIQDSHLVILLDRNDIDIFKNRKIMLYGKAYPCCGKKFIHRIIAENKLGEINRFVVDHINGNKFDSRSCNLRICSPSENSHNKIRQKNNTTGFIGVSKQKNKDYFVSTIKINNITKTIGYFNNKRDAAIARDIYAKKYIKDFAILNIPNASDEEIKNVIKKLESNKRNSKSSSCYYGVRLNKISKTWIAEFFLDKKRYYLGYYDNEKQAAKAVDKKLIKIGNLKKLNFNRKTNISI